MFEGINHLHSALRYLIVLLLIITIIKAFSGWLGKKNYTSVDKKLGLFTLIFTHIQLVLGLVLYIISPTVSEARTNVGEAMKDPLYRFFLVEHIAMMLIAIALITIGYSRSKRGRTDISRHKTTAIFYLIGFLVMFFSIPWPFLKTWGTWF